MKGSVRRAVVDEHIVALAASQHGVVARRQLLGLGLTSGEVNARRRGGMLMPLHRGVYLLGHLRGPLEPSRAGEMAAVLACGRGTLVGLRSAARLWNLLGDSPSRRRSERRATVDVLVPPGRTPTRRAGIRAHRTVQRLPGDATILDGIPVTSPARTLFDLAGVASGRELEQAVARAEREELVTPDELAALVERRRGRRGVERLRAIVERGPAALTRSEAELRFLEIVRAAGLPEPEVNVTVDGRELDFLWRDERLVVEVDGFAYHRSRIQFVGDRRRDAQLLASGLRVMRVTWEQIVEERLATVVRVAQALARGPVAPPADRAR